MSRLLGWLIALVWLSGLAGAHDLGVARVRIEQATPGAYRVEVRGPAKIELGAPAFPARFELDGAPTLRAEGRSWLHGFRFTTAGAPLGSGDALNLPWEREGAFVRIRTLDGSDTGRYFQSSDDGIPVDLGTLLASERPLLEVVEHYAVLGVEHILFGWDHLAFVLCLCLIARGWRLVRLVSAFTLGHSLTLAAAVLDVARVPIAPVEACIALSIAFVAREALVHGRESTHGGWLVAAFGLLHGLGFASALGESGIGAAEVLPGLLAFNLGVEAGQLLFVGFVVALGAGLARVAPYVLRTRPAVAYGLGLVALFWTVERAALIAGVL